MAFLENVVYLMSFFIIPRRHAINNSKVPKKLKSAYLQGLEYNTGEESFKKCYKDYPICPYSAKTMLKFISFMNKFS